MTRRMILVTLPAGVIARAHAADRAAGPDGFRSAKFGMTEPEVRDAIRHDFPHAPAPVLGANPSEGTAVLSLRLADLLPDSGPAEAAFIFGYSSHRLIQVNLLWRSDGRSPSRDQAIVAAANLLRDSLVKSNRDAERVLVNRKLKAGGILVFRATYPDGRMVALVLTGQPVSARRAKSSVAPEPLTLELAYIRNFQKPDVFHLKPGAF